MSSAFFPKNYAHSFELRCVLLWIDRCIFYLYPYGLLHWRIGYERIWVNIPHESITTLKQRTTKLCAYSMRQKLFLRLFDAWLQIWSLVADDTFNFFWHNSREYNWQNISSDLGYGFVEHTSHYLKQWSPLQTFYSTTQGDVLICLNCKTIP